MPREKSKWRPPRGERTDAEHRDGPTRTSEEGRSCGRSKGVGPKGVGPSGWAKRLGQAVVVNVQLATGGDLGGNEAVRHPEAVGGEGLSGGESQRRGGRGGRSEP